MKNILVLSFLAIALGGVSFAADAKSNYQAKKQGQVQFEEDKSQDTEATSAEEETSPADIEPAAGASDDTASEEDDIAEKIKLPRK